MHEERYEVPAETAKSIAETRHRGKSVWAVGTTSVRTLTPLPQAPPARTVTVTVTQP